MELSDRDAIESSFAARMGRLHGSLRRRLIELLGNPPDPTNVPDSFWIEAEDEMRRELAIVLMLIFAASARQHGLAANMAEVNGLRYADLRSRLISSDFISNSRARLVEFKNFPTATRTEVATTVFSPSRAESIATTETTAATSAGGELATVQTIGISELDTWYTMDDSGVCPICQPLHSAPRTSWMAVFPDGPPAHPNCRCWIQYAAEKAEELQYA